MDVTDFTLSRALAAARRWIGLEPRDMTSVQPASPPGGGWFQILRPSIAGVRVDRERAFMVAAVWACIDSIAAPLAASDWNVYAGVRGSDADKRVLTDDRLQSLLNLRPNEEMTAQACKRALAIAAVGTGNGYAEIEWDRAGRPIGLWPLSPERVEARRDAATRRLLYRVQQDTLGGTVDLDPVDVFHIRGASLIGSVGADPIGRAVQSISLAIAVDSFASTYFASGTQLGGILSTEAKLDKTQRAALAAEWNTRSQGSGHAHRTAVLDAGLKWTQITSDAERSQMVDARYQLIEEICRWFRVAPHKIAHLLRATNNNIEHQGLEFSRDTLRPWVKEIEQEADYKLLSARGPRRFIEIDLDWAEQGDYKSRAEALQILRNIGVFSANDVLRKLGENTIGAEGDLRIVNGSSMLLKDVGKAPAPAPRPPAPAAAAPAPDGDVPPNDNHQGATP